MFVFNGVQRNIMKFVFWAISKINIKLLVTLICLVFIGISIYGNFEDLSNQRISLSVILWLIGGIIFTLCSIFLNAYAWKLLINSIGCNSNKIDVIKIFINTNIYKYMPGGIWHFVSRYNILRLKFSKEKSAESILLEPLLMLVAGSFFIPFGGFNISIFLLCWSSPLVLIAELREFLIRKLKVFKASIFTNNEKGNERKLLQNHFSTLNRISYPYSSLAVEIVFIFFRFLGFLFCLNAFSIGSLIYKGKLISFFSLAWIIGLVVPAAPGGLGVFESVILFCLGSHLPEASLLASLLCYRLVSTVSDILAALVYPAKGLFKV